MESIVRRREFLGMSLAFVSSLRAAEPQANFPTEPRQRLSVSTYPFRSVIDSSRRHDRDRSKLGMTLEQFAETVQSKFQVSGIEPWSPHFKSAEPDYMRHVNDAFKKAGLRVVNLPVDEPVNLCSAQAGDSERGQALYRKWADAAVILGSPGIRVHAPEGEINCAVQALKILAEYGAQKNVVINLENDNPRSEDPFRVLKIIETVNSPYLRALPDFCNSMLIKNDQQYNDRALQALFPHAFNISHVKDMEVDEGKVYRVDVDRIFAIAKKAGYRGYFSMEWEGSGDPYNGTRRLLEQSLKNLA
ncbi:MAG: sugar phosphate isomerase/epimerase family protein [Bryobacteraceae bacterium]